MTRRGAYAILAALWLRRQWRRRPWVFTLAAALVLALSVAGNASAFSSSESCTVTLSTPEGEGLSPGDTATIECTGLWEGDGAPSSNATHVRVLTGNTLRWGGPSYDLSVYGIDDDGFTWSDGTGAANDGTLTAAVEYIGTACDGNPATLGEGGFACDPSPEYTGSGKLGYWQPGWSDQDIIDDVTVVWGEEGGGPGGGGDPGSAALYDAGMTVALGFFALGVVFLFISGMLLGLIDFTRRLIG